MAEGSIDWDALAPFWHHFEDEGFSDRAMSVVESALRPPCLYIGAGLGTYAARLDDTLGVGSVTAVDRSLAMLRRGRRTLPAVCADAAELPFARDSFASALVATGVLEPSRDRLRILGELARVVTPAGMVVVAVFLPTGQPFDTWDDLAAWHRCTERREAWRGYDAVATELADRDAAYRVLRAALPRRARAVSDDDLAAAASSSGFAVTARVDSPPSVRVFGLTRPR